MSRHQVFITVALADLDAARALAAGMDPGNDGQSFKATLSPTGAEPATHHGASVMADEDRLPDLVAAADSLASARIASDYDGTFAQWVALDGLRPVIGAGPAG